MPSTHGNADVQNRVRRHPSDSGFLYVNFTNKLPSGVALSSVAAPTSNPTGLTFSSVQVNTETFVDDNVTPNETVAVGKGALFKVSGVIAGQSYDITVVGTGDDDETYGLDCPMDG